MSFSKLQLQELTRQAIVAAQSAGKLILEYSNKQVPIGHKAMGNSQASKVVTEVDHKAQAIILDQLNSSLKDYDLGLLAEEAQDSGERHTKPAFWCIDPMDGTLAFVNNVPGYTVSISLVSQSGLPLIGVVYDPVKEITYQACQGQGAFRNNKQITIPKLDPKQPLILQTDYSFQTDKRLNLTQSGLEAIADSIGVDGARIEYQIGAVNNACSVLEMPNICYFKYPRSDSSGGSLWDYAATACICNQAGAIACDLYGDAMDLNREDSAYMNHRGILFAGHQTIAREVIALNEQLMNINLS